MSRFITEPSRNIYRHELQTRLDDHDCETINDVMNVLFGEQYDMGSSDFVVKHRFPDRSTPTFIQRFNLMWVLVVFVICIPFRYLMFGSYQVNENTRLGRVLTKLLGEGF